MKITVSTEIEAPAAVVWRCYTTPGDIVCWNAASDDWHTTSASVDLQAGGRFCSRMEAKDGSVGFDFEGVYTRVVEAQLLEYDFGERHAEVRFTEHDGGTTVTVAFDAEETHSIEQQHEGWKAILGNFKRYVESSATPAKAP